MNDADQKSFDERLAAVKREDPLIGFLPSDGILFNEAAAEFYEIPPLPEGIEEAPAFPIALTKDPITDNWLAIWRDTLMIDGVAITVSLGAIVTLHYTVLNTAEIIHGLIEAAWKYHAYARLGLYTRQSQQS